MNIKTIYDELLAGKVLAVQFETVGQVHTFRAKLYKYKKRQDQVLLAMEMIDETQILRITEVEVDHSFLLKLQLIERGPAKSYTVHILEEPADVS